MSRTMTIKVGIPEGARWMTTDEDGRVKLWHDRPIRNDDSSIGGYWYDPDPDGRSLYQFPTWTDCPTWRDSLRRLDADSLREIGGDREGDAPRSHLPDWSECAVRVDNSRFIAERGAEGGHGPEPDSKLATALHQFIYEYDDADPYRSAWFRHRLESVITEVRRGASNSGDDADSLREIGGAGANQTTEEVE